MRFWHSEDPRFQKKMRILHGCVRALILAYVAVAVVLAVISRREWLGGWIVLAAMGLLALVMAPILWASVRFIRWCMMVKHGVDVPDKAMDKALSITAFVSGMMALALFLLITLLNVDPGYPWDNLGGEPFLMVTLSVSFGALLFNGAAQTTLRWMERRGHGEKQVIVARGLRRVGIAVVALILVGTLLIPYESGTYNDGGSTYHKATLYEVIEWDRKPAEGAMALPDDFDPNEEQKTRVYVFPFNRYTFNAKWDLKH